MPTIQEFFKWGLDRDIKPLLDPPAYRTRYTSTRWTGGRGWLTEAAFRADPEAAGARLPWLNLGPGDRKKIAGTTGVGPESNALTEVPWVWRGLRPSEIAGELQPVEPLPYDDECVGAIHAHQFMEHFAADDAIGILRECERVLVPGGVMFITTPYPGHGHFTQALDHKTMWTEETWSWLFHNTYYNNLSGWKLRVHACFMMGVVYRNLDLFTQLVKEER